MISLKMGVIIVAAFVAGAFLASPELRAYASTIANDVVCTGCVGTSDLSGNAVTSAKIKDGEVKTAEIASGAVTNAKLANGAVNSAKIADNSIKADDIATDAVGAAELQGVTKLMYGQCVISPALAANIFAAGAGGAMDCIITGVDSDDSAVGMFNVANDCFVVHRARPIQDAVSLWFHNICGAPASLGAGSNAGVIVYDK